jgi:hypothetical protein
MGNLTLYLQNAFADLCPANWTCRSEVRLLSEEFNELFGYSSRADVLLAKTDGSRRLWIEFEISRADPVANHAKFATAHLFSRQLETDCFVSMVSSHVQRGRRNLAANTIHVMREAGMNAFQTVLLPELGPDKIKLLNHARLEDMQNYVLPVGREIERALSISKSVGKVRERRIHFASNLLEVLLNLRRWNHELLTQEGRALWGKRTITYFVFDPITQTFAPSKFCAYIPVGKSFDYAAGRAVVEMTVALYSTLETESSFDGNRAQTHLTKFLAMGAFNLDQRPDILPVFDRWLTKYSDCINVSPRGPVFLVPNHWLI